MGAYLCKGGVASRLASILACGKLGLTAGALNYTSVRPSDQDNVWIVSKDDTTLR
jgi:hypothetical protein